MIVGLIFTFGANHFVWDKALYILSIGIGVYGALQLLSAQLFTSGQKRGLVEIVYDLNNMLKTMRQLAVVAAFTWFAMFAWSHLIARRPSLVTHFGTKRPPDEGLQRRVLDWVGVLNLAFTMGWRPWWRSSFRSLRPKPVV